MSTISTHVLDTARGRPAGGLPVTLEVEGPGGWQLVSKGTTNADGRLSDLISAEASIGAGVYRLIFDTGRYFAGQQIENFYPLVTVVFKVSDAAQHYHVPLLLSPFGYSTYRGS
jgi:5-hydroxyisourate hydrolase